MLFLKNYQPYPGFNFLKKIFIVLGLPPFSTIYATEKNRFFRFNYKVYVVFIEFIFYSTMLRMVLRPILHTMTVSSFIEFFAASTYISQSFIRTLILYKREKIILNYLTIINERSEDYKIVFDQLFESKYKTPKKFSKIVFSLQIIFTILSFFVGPFLLVGLEINLLPFAYVLVELHYSMKWVYQVLDAFVGIYFTARSSAIDLLYLTFVIYHITQQELIKNDLKIILENIKKEKGEDMALRKWFKLHKESLRQIKELKKFLEPLLSVTYVYNLISIVNLIFLILVAGDMHWGQKALGGGSSFTCFLVLGWLCILADSLTEQHEAMPQQFDLDFVVKYRHLKSKFLILSIRCQRAVKISAFQYFVINSKNFTEVVSATFSLFAAVWQIRNRMKNF